MQCTRQTRVALRVTVLLLLLSAAPARAVTVAVDFDEFGTASLFNAGTPQGLQARAAVNAAASYYSGVLIDTLALIDPPEYHNGDIHVYWNWTMGLNHPNSSTTITRVDELLAADEFRVYVGARNHAGSTLGVGSPGWVQTWGRLTPGNLSSSDRTAVEAIDDVFEAAITERGETSGFAAWGGSISFDNDTNWHLDHTTAPPAGKSDLFSVALHELGHTLGFGASDSWNSLVSGSNFVGVAAMSGNGGPVPLAADGAHWQNGIVSAIYGLSTFQTPLMAESLPAGSRRRVTAVDLGALIDIGWSAAPPTVLPGDYNRNGVVEAADYVVWRNTRGQNVTPGSGADGSGNGNVGAEDYSFWRARFGTSLFGNGGSLVDVGVAVVPEPATWLVTAFAVLFAFGTRKRNSSFVFAVDWLRSFFMSRARTMIGTGILKLITIGAALAVVAAPAFAINVAIDYTYDTNNFFGAGNPQGAAAGMQAKNSLEAAADFFTNILNDTFSSIETPPPYFSSVFDGQVTWEWDLNFDHPATDALVTLTNPMVPANQYIIYAGARSIGGNTAGIGGPGGFGWSSLPSGGFTQQEINEIEAITADFEEVVETRGEPSGFSRWGGAVTFDREGTTWHYNHTTAPSGNVTDFFSVAIHELGHALGFGASEEFQLLISGSQFHGANAHSEYGGPVPLSGGGHWAFDTMSTVYGTATPQEAAMDPNVLNGTRKMFTDLDAAALKDIGWDVIALAGLDGDYNNNGTVDAADYVVWRDNFNQPVAIPNDRTPGMVTQSDYNVWRANFGKASGSGSLVQGSAVPEPASSLLANLSGIAVLFARRARHG